MTGGELQLAAYGEQDLNLTGNPQITFFRAVYKRYTNFAIENMQEIITGHTIFGAKTYITLGRWGDLINKMELDIVLPALNPTNDPNFAISWINSIGHALIKQVDIEINGNIIDTHYGMWMEIWSELTLPAEKRYGYYNMIGKHEYFNVTIQQGELHLRVPFQFWFCENIGLSIPNIALYNSTIRLIITFQDFDNLWVSSTGNLIPLEQHIATCRTHTKHKCTVKDHFNIIRASVFVDYIFLDNDERRFFVNHKHQYLINLLGRNVISTNLTGTNNIIQLDDFNFPVKELIWVIRDNFVLKKVSGGGNECFNFSNRPSYFNIPPKDPMVDAIIYFEGQQRFFPARDPKYFRELEPYKRHSNVPDNFIYIYSFALQPEIYQPTGTCDFSRLDNATLNLRVLEELNDPQINIFAPFYNILLIEGGMAGLKYGS